ncbi:MAG: OmpW family protein [Sphingomonadales bacterium]|nr:MAG: OmpW family protein [Sphingomonadales bacterium]TNF04680.1 MAG: OmpW family protein [Sphingomonadales bacterium]
MREKRKMWSPPKQKNRIFIAVAMVVSAMASPALAEDYRPKAGDISVRTGPVGILFDSSAKFKVLGTDLPGANLHASDGLTLSFEAEVYVVPEVSLTLTLGIPPTTDVDGRGILDPVGKLGSVRYGLGGVLAKYHLNQSSPFQPFVGAGVAHFVSFKEKDAAVSNLNVDGSWGPMVQGGAEYMLDSHIGIYASISYAWMKTDGSGVYGGAPLTADVTLNPTAVQGGMLFRF